MAVFRETGVRVIFYLRDLQKSHLCVELRFVVFYIKINAGVPTAGESENQKTKV